MVVFDTLKSNDSLIDDFISSVRSVETDEMYLYWFSKEKIEKNNFVNIEVALLDGKVIAFSGCSLLSDGRLRVIQMLYTLPQYRKQYRDLCIQKGGFIDRHIATAKELGVDKLVTCVHAFNSKTKTMERLFLKNKKNRFRGLKLFEYKGIGIFNHTEQHYFEYDMYKELKEKLRILDIMPLGEHETLPVTRTNKDLLPIKRLYKVSDCDSLYDEYMEYDKTIPYIGSRINILEENGIDIEEYKDYMKCLGFNKNSYRVYPLRDLNGNILIDKDTYTYDLLTSWPCPIFRPQYNCAQTDWKLEEHVDHTNTLVHGYRVLIPLNKNMNIRIDGEEYVLNAGYAYFIDVTRPHSAWAEDGRVAISFQMTDDFLL